MENNPQKLIALAFALCVGIPQSQCFLEANIAYGQRVGSVEPCDTSGIRWFRSSLSNNCFETGYSFSCLQQLWVDVSRTHSVSAVSLLSEDVSALSNLVVTVSAHNNTSGGSGSVCYSGTARTSNVSRSSSGIRISFECHQVVSGRYIRINIERPIAISMQEVVVLGRFACSSVGAVRDIKSLGVYTQGTWIQRCQWEYQVLSRSSLDTCDRPGHQYPDTCLNEQVDQSVADAGGCDHWGLWRDQHPTCNAYSTGFCVSWSLPTKLTWSGCEYFRTPSGNDNINYPGNETWWSLSSPCHTREMSFEALQGRTRCVVFFEMMFRHSYTISDINFQFRGRIPSCTNIVTTLDNTVCSARNCGSSSLDYECEQPTNLGKTLKLRIDLSFLGSGDTFSISRFWACAEIFCGRPPIAANASVAYSLVNGGVATYWCDEGYGRVSGDYNLTCASNRSWQGRQLVCGRACREPPVHINVQMSPGDSWLPGSVARQTCLRGYTRVSGDYERSCRVDYSWSGTQLICEEEKPTTEKILTTSDQANEPTTTEEDVLRNIGETTTLAAVATEGILSKQRESDGDQTTADAEPTSVITTDDEYAAPVMPKEQTTVDGDGMISSATGTSSKRTSSESWRSTRHGRVTESQTDTHRSSNDFGSTSTGGRVVDMTESSGEVTTGFEGLAEFTDAAPTAEDASWNLATAIALLAAVGSVVIVAAVAIACLS